MENHLEKEIKILNVNTSEVENKLIKLEATKDFDYIQNIATYQFSTPKTRYLNILNQLQEPSHDKAIVLEKLKNLFVELSSL